MSVEKQLANEIRTVVLYLVRESNWDADQFAEKANLVPTYAKALLEAPVGSWTLNRCLYIAGQLKLPLTVSLV